MASTARRAGVARGTHSSEKLAQQTARKIETDIVRQRWPLGRCLGSEADLRERFGVSRAVLREAVRLLEHHQVATMRRGPSGGLFVRSPDPDSATRALIIYLERVGTTLPDLVSARLLLESLAVELAVARLDEEGIRQLREALDQEAQFRASSGMSAPYLHQAIGGLSNNPALELFINMLTALTERYSRAASTHTPAAHRRSADMARHAHVAISEAMIAGDVSVAQHRIRKHIEAIADWLTGQSQQLSAADEPEHSSVAPTAKLAEVVAEQVRRDIAKQGLNAGDLLGSERDLQVDYDVSRSVFREAVRLLEYHSIAVMRRGPGGGLVVAEPDPQAAIETMGLYLDYKGIRVEDLRILRETLELGCVDHVAKLIDDEVVYERLRASLEVDTSTPEGEVLERSRTFHTELADLSANPVLSVFLRVLMEVWVRHSAALPADPGAQSGPFAPQIEAIHGAIVDAILAGDSALAKHRMRRHLEALTDVWRP
ncbi:GntR family transcriptional regulator [Mycolicibacterium anyangense]|jgi:DNA-binding FadR family transcriptional regulator|uniref:GntR family transcriptional regulator n=1 Tax=Mycolicibacterium anyangense TaxID=1431246 RepID=A0A6N4WAM6_9MYCO|nr:FCD domain-containing protein [Mycolicibacterium anyangense]BBZ77094.1 GntR family transcriptional regulator [Mycolicibacterium anyangense]